MRLRGGTWRIHIENIVAAPELDGKRLSIRIAKKDGDEQVLTVPFQVRPAAMP